MRTEVLSCELSEPGFAGFKDLSGWLDSLAVSSRESEFPPTEDTALKISFDKYFWYMLI